jgi:protein-tyrosine phosphatase
MPERTKVPPARRLLFVCMGNICRSPTAHGVMRHKVRVAGLEAAIDVDSAGTHGWHEGDPPDERAIEHARRRGYHIADLRARALRPADFERFDRLLVMDEANRAAARRIGPAAQHGKLRLLTEYRLGHRAIEVPDPYHGGAAGFEYVLDLVEDACEGLIQQLMQELQAR